MPFLKIYIMKKSNLLGTLGLVAGIGAMAETDHEMNLGTFIPPEYTKRGLTKKQRKVRIKNKMARKSRQINRKKK